MSNDTEALGGSFGVVTNDAALGGSFGNLEAPVTQTVEDVAVVVTNDTALGGSFGSSESHLTHTAVEDAVISALQAEASNVSSAINAANSELSALAAEADRVQTGLDRVQTGLDTVSTANDVTQTGSDLDSTNADVLLTHADVVLTHTDVTTTNTNVILVEADKVQTGLDKVATNADVVLTNADAVLTESNKVQTGLDKIATNADVVLTHADVVLAEADKVQTGLDRIAVNADKIQTGLDKTATNADAVSTGAAVLLTNADVITTNTNVGLTNADVILAEADKVQTGLDRIATAAGVLITGSDVVITNANVVSTTADALSTASDVVTTNADVLLTHADLAATNANRVAIETLYDTFDDRYLGTKATDPTLDNDGAALLIGAIYFNSATNTTRFYNGVAWEVPEVTSTTAATTATDKALEASNSAAAALVSEGLADADRVATNADVILTAASEAAAALSASTATTQASTATTKAVEASASASDSLTSANNSASSATTASTSEVNAASSASAAYTSSINASQSEGWAYQYKETSIAQAALAATSATNAENAWDSFDDRYLGAKNIVPLTDNDGNTLVEGTLYWSTSANDMYVYNGIGWQLVGSAINGTSARFEFVATAAQTTFVTTGFDPGYADVYQNGIKLINTVDFDDTDGINIILTNGANLDDEISVIAYGSFLLADHYSKTVSDARYLQLTGGVVTGSITATDFIGPLNGAVQFTAKNDEGIAITKGQAVYIKGVSGDVATVGLADANDSTKMPAFGLVAANANNNAEVEIVTFGSLADTKTDYTGWAFGDTLYVSTTPGLLTNSAPAGEASKIQNIGKVQRVHASAGIIRTGGAGRTNATPNLDDGNVFIGNASNQSVARALVVADTTGLQTALDLKANQATTYTKTETDTAISNLVAAAPATLDTLNELAAALGDDPNFATTVTNSVALKAPLASPSFTGDIAVTGNVDGRDLATDGTKLDGIETGATADQTAAQILTSIKTVDGSGSGLDADLLDGQHASAFWQNSGAWVGTHTDKTRVYGVSSGGGEVWLGYAGGKGNVIVDGEFYANEGNSKVWHAGNDSGIKMKGKFAGIEGPSSWASAFKNNWTGNSHTNDSSYFTIGTAGVTVLKTGYYRCQGVQRAADATNRYFALSVNGSRATIEDRTTGIWGHDHSGVVHNWSHSYYTGILNAGEVLGGGWDTASTGQFSTAGSTGFITVELIEEI